MAHGKCLKGKHLLMWEPPPRVKDAYCPIHNFPLALTSRQSELDIIQERPTVGLRHTTNGRMLKEKMATLLRRQALGLDPE